jgi:C-terminal processing protease CtpA/Prc
MNVRITSFPLFIVLILSLPSSAAEQGRMGFSVNVVVEGSIFSPKIKEIRITEVFSDSPAEKAGLKIGQKVLSIDGCVIPGCSARKAKKIMNKKPGEILVLEIEKMDGTRELINIHAS